jgi:hypothetical protein
MYLKTSFQSRDPELPMRLVVSMPKTPVKKESGSWNDVRVTVLIFVNGEAEMKTYEYNCDDSK